jgi:molybdenum cofactor guanylyltransferase
MKVLGVIIAGGKSSRMLGREKAFLKLANVPLIERVSSRIRFQVHAIAINANGDVSRFASLGVPVIQDAVALHSPLAGIHAAISYGASHGYDSVLTVPSDTPLLPLDLVERLEEECCGGGQQQPHPLSHWLVVHGACASAGWFHPAGWDGQGAGFRAQGCHGRGGMVCLSA